MRRNEDFMAKINLLDCTLRDGGYLNDWEFGQDNIVNIFERLGSMIRTGRYFRMLYL